MKRIVLFLATNIAVLLVLSVVLHLLGIDSILDRSGTHLDLNALLIMSAVVGMAGSFISLAMSKFLAKMSTGAKIITQPRTAAETWLVETVGRLAREAGIGMPDVAIYDSPDMNAFATGMNRNHALVAVSTGLLQQMQRDEVEAVLGHEVSHVANGDMVTMALLQGVLNTFVFFLSRVVGFVIDRAVFRTERGYGPGYFISVIVSQIVFGILASVVVSWFSRQREFRADAGSGRLAGASKMIAALRRLQAAHEPSQLPQQMAAFGIAGGGNGFMRLFRSHPPIEERIAALQSAG